MAKVDGGEILSQISFTDDNEAAVSLEESAYEELSSEKISDSRFYVALDLSSISKNNITTSASIRYAFKKEPDAPEFKNLTFEETVLTISMKYSL